MSTSAEIIDADSLLLERHLVEGKTAHGRRQLRPPPLAARSGAQP